jgi:hypothetical protein
MSSKGILLDKNNNLKISNQALQIGDTMLQEVGLILQMSQGEMKFNPLIGANLTTMIRSVDNREKIQRHIAIQMELDGKDYDTVKEKLKLNIS